MTVALRSAASARLVPIGPGWAGNTANVTVFRRHSLTSFGTLQYAAYYDQAGHVVLARREIGTQSWQVHTTRLTGNVRDAHVGAAIAVDGRGVLHLAWGHHDGPLRYCRCRTLEPGSAEPMTGLHEGRVSYPEFYNLPEGDLLFLYRDGRSGCGNLVVNRYDARGESWRQLHQNLIAGGGRRSAYWQAAVDASGGVHLSWVWRDSADVESNHDLAYARSPDGGRTWLRSDGEPYSLPITAEAAEYAARIPPGHELINQTSMSTDADGLPYIATYWRAEGEDVPQYRLVRRTAAGWEVSTIGRRTLPFRLRGRGTKSLPLSRPQILVRSIDGRRRAYMLFRDQGHGNRAAVMVCDDLSEGVWAVHDLTESTVGQWEPTYDVTLWDRVHAVHVFLQRAEQIDGEGVADAPPEVVYVLEWEPTA